MMTKADAIEAITKLNPTATPGFLAGFPADELSRYLDRLESVARRLNRHDPTDGDALSQLPDSMVTAANGAALPAAVLV